MFQVHRRRHDLIAQREHRDAGFQSAGAAQQMPGHRLGRADQHLVGVIAEGTLDGRGFEFIAQRRRCAVSIDVADLLRRDAGIAQRIAHHAVAAFAREAQAA